MLRPDPCPFILGIKDSAQNSLMSYSYDYSPMGNVNAKNTQDGNYSYQYDDLYRLTGATNPGSTEFYTYDTVGNRLTSADVTGQWSYNANNELTAYGDVSYEYDLNGNITRKTDSTGVTTFSYDIDNRLVQLVTPNSQLVTYYYDSFGRRLSKEVDGVKTCFFYSDEGLIGEYNGSGVEIKTYGYAPNSTWTTNPLFQKIGTSYYWYQNDHLGTPQKMIDSSGAVVWSARYDALGKAQIQVAAIENNLRFPGQYYDHESGLHYNYSRYYIPQAGRYVTADPIGLWGGINLFVYVQNDPLNLIDPLGLIVEAPGFWEGLIPIWGSGRQAINDFQCGRLGWGVINGALAISDVFLVKSAFSAIGKGVLKLGSHAWPATSKWLSKTAWREFKGQEMHHWFIPQGGWGKYVPDAIKNQPWNLMGMPMNPAFHDALHGGGELAMSALERIWKGTPTWFKVGIPNVGGKIGNIMRGGKNDCICN